MKPFTLAFLFLLITPIIVLSQSGMVIKPGGAVTVQGNTYISCLNPAAPGIQVPSGTQITWNWYTVPGASGYKWSTTNDYYSATDLGTATSMLETGLTCITSYTRYVWAYGACGISTPTVLTQATTPDPPMTPAAGIHISSTTQITWIWNAVSNTAGYKWNSVNDYATAIDLGTAVTKTETGLTCGTGYTRYVWAYTPCGTSTALTLTQSTSPCPFPCGQTLTDTRNGQTYGTVMIGTQCWMTKNMNIGTLVDPNYDQINNNILEKYCYDNNESNCTTYGGLYQWGEMVQYLNGASNATLWNPAPTGNVQGICPSGWHIAKDEEWTTLVDFLGGASVAGGKMKEQGYAHWNSPNTGATNSSGFTALAGGNSYCCVGSFIYIGVWADFHTASQVDFNHVRSRSISKNYTSINSEEYWGTRGRSARCLLD